VSLIAAALAVALMRLAAAAVVVAIEVLIDPYLNSKDCFLGLNLNY
jgi:hypothetical protein